MGEITLEARRFNRRRFVLLSATAASTALLAACGGAAPVPTLTVPPTPAPPPTAPPPSATTRAPASASTAATATTGGSAAAAGTRVGSASAASGGTLAGTPASVAAQADLSRMLAFVPLSGLDQFDPIFSLTFANVGEAKQRYGLASIRGDADLQAHNVSAATYSNATRGCALSNFTGISYSASGIFRDAFGYDVYQVDREIWAGQPPHWLSHMEGAFDADAIVAKLRGGGYATMEHNGSTFLTIRDDYKFDPADPRSSLALATLNRIAVSPTRIIAAPATELITAALDAEAKRRPSLDAFPTMRALAAALGDVTSMATMRPPLDDAATAVLAPDRFATTTAGIRDWGTLPPAELTAMGYTELGNARRTIHAALVYTNPADATAAAPELMKRLMRYQSTRTGQPLIPTFATGVTTRTLTVAGKGVLIADIAQTADPMHGGLWQEMLAQRDTLFLVPAPLGANGTPVPTIVLPGAASATATPRP